MPSFELVEAVNSGSAELVRELLSTELDEPERIAWLNQSLLRSTYDNRKEAVAALLQVGAEPDCTDGLGKTSLHWAAHQGHEGLVTVLADGGATVGAKSNDDITPLHVAAAHNMGQVARTLLRYRANITDVTTDKRSPLHLAAEHGSAIAAAVLVEAPHQEALAKYNEELARRQEGLDAQIDLAAEAVEHPPEPKLVVPVLEMETDRGESPLVRAAGRDQAAVVQLLITNGANMEHANWWGQRALHIAALGGHVACAAVLIDSSAAVDSVAQDGSTPLHTACDRGSVAVTELLLSSGASVQHCAAGGRCPLHAAAEKGCLQICEALLAHKAAPDSRTEEQRTALSFAAGRGHVDVVKLLCSYADVDLADNVKQAPIHAAASTGRADVIEVLAEHRARLQDRDLTGRTPIHHAVSNRHLPAVKALLKRGCTLPDELKDAEMTQLEQEVELELVEELAEKKASGAFDQSVLQAAESELEQARLKLLELASNIAKVEMLPHLKEAEAAAKDAAKYARDCDRAEKQCLEELVAMREDMVRVQADIDHIKPIITQVSDEISSHEGCKQQLEAEIEEIRQEQKVLRKRLPECLKRNSQLADILASEESKAKSLEAELIELKNDEERLQKELEAVRQDLDRWDGEKHRAAELHAQAQALLSREVVHRTGSLSPVHAHVKDDSDGMASVEQSPRSGSAESSQLDLGLN